MLLCFHLVEVNLIEETNLFAILDISNYVWITMANEEILILVSTKLLISLEQFNFKLWKTKKKYD